MSVNQPPQNNFYPIYGDYIDIGNVFVKKDDVKKINRSNNLNGTPIFEVELKSGQTVKYPMQDNNGVHGIWTDNDGKSICMKNIEWADVHDNPKLDEKLIFYGDCKYNAFFSYGGDDGIVTANRHYRSGDISIAGFDPKEIIKKPEGYQHNRDENGNRIHNRDFAIEYRDELL